MNMHTGTNQRALLMSALMNVPPAWWPFKNHCRWHANLCNWVTRERGRGERERRELRRAVIVFIFIFLVFVVVVVIYVFISYFFLCLLSLFSFFPLLFYFEWALRKLHQGELFTFPLCPLPFSFFTLPSSAFAVAPNLRIPSTFELRSDCAAAAPRYNLSARLAGLALPTDIAQLKGIGKQKVRQQRCVAKASKKGSHSGCKYFSGSIETL